MRRGESWPQVPLSELRGEVSCSTCDRGPYPADNLTLSRVPILTRASWLWIPGLGGWVCPVCQENHPGARVAARSMRIRRIRERLRQGPLWRGLESELQELERIHEAEKVQRRRRAS